MIGSERSNQLDLDAAVEEGSIEYGSDAWKTYVANAIVKPPAQRTKAEKDTISIAMDASTIAVQVEQAAREAFDDGKFYELRRRGRIPTTAAIKQTFHDLGIKLGLRGLS